MGLKPSVRGDNLLSPAIHRRAMHNPAFQCRVPEPNMFSPAFQCRRPTHPYQFFYLNSPPAKGESPGGGRGFKPHTRESLPVEASSPPSRASFQKNPVSLHPEFNIPSTFI